MTARLLRSMLAAVCLVTVGAQVLAQDATDQQEVSSPFPETARPHEVLLHPHREQRDKYLWGTFGPPGLMDAALSAAIDQWMDKPELWDQTKSGYLQRFSTEYAEASISASTKYALARLRDEDPSFRRCECSGFRRRALHAIISPFIAYRFDDDRPQFSVAKMAGTATSSAISANTWKPPQSGGQQLVHFGTDMLSAMGVDLLREFVFHRREPH
jgi:hypothetical protein